MAKPNKKNGGLIEAGNIDLKKRPRVKNSDGTISTIKSKGYGIDGVEVLLPTIDDDGKELSDDEAKALYKKTGKHLGKFKDIKSSTDYGKALSKGQDEMLKEESHEDLVKAAEAKWEHEQLVKAAEAKWVAENSKGQNEPGFIDATIEDLPALGAMTGAALGFSSPVPGGTLAGAGVGGFAGQATKNLINTYRHPEQEKTASEYMLEPLEAGANSITGEVVGQKIVAPALEIAGKGIKKGLELGGKATNWALKKAGKIVANVPEGYTEEYLQRSGKIEARPLDQIMDEITTLHNEAKNTVNQSEKEVLERRVKLQNLKEELSTRKQLMEDQFADQRYLTDQKSIQEREKFRQASQVLKEDLQGVNVTGLRNEIVDSIESLKEKVIHDSIESYNILGNQKGKISSKPLIDALDQGMEDLTLKGDILTGTDQAAFQELSKLKERLVKLGKEVSFPEAKFVLQRLGHDTTWTPNAGNFAKLSDLVKQNARKAFDKVVKDKVSAYKKHMLMVDEQTRLLKELSQKFGTPELALGRLENLASTKGRNVDFELLKKLGKIVNKDFERPINKFLLAKRTLKTPSDLRNLEKLMPEYAPYVSAMQEQERLAMPATRRQIRQRILKTPEYEALQAAKKELDSAIKAQQAAELQYSDFAPFNLGQVQAKVKALTGARDYAPTKLFDKLDKVSGKNFSQEIKDRAILDSFEKGDTQGSRKTLMGAIAGKAISSGLGAILGYETSGNMTGATVGGMAGFSGDKYAGKVLKFLLNRRINASQAMEYLSPYLQGYTDPLVKAAERGPGALSVVGSALAVEPGFRRLLGLPAIGENKSIQIPIPSSEYQAALLQIDGSQNLNNVEKAKAIDLLNRTGKVDSQYLNKVILDPGIQQNHNQQIHFEDEEQHEEEQKVNLEDVVNSIRNRK